jgi:hypothetical protein
MASSGVGASRIRTREWRMSVSLLEGFQTFYVYLYVLEDTKRLERGRELDVEWGDVRLVLGRLCRCCRRRRRSDDRFL